jgi:hypothetical protein
MAVPEIFDEAKNMNYIASGFKNPPFFQKPNLAPSMSFAGQLPEIEKKLQMVKTEQAPVVDSWNSRR